MAAKRSGLKRALLYSLGTIVLLAGLLAGGVRLVDHLVPQYRQSLASRIGARIGAEVDIDALAVGWSWRGPHLELEDMTVTRDGAGAPAAQFAHVGLGFDLYDLIQGTIRPNTVVLEDARLTLQVTRAGRVRLAHWSRADDPPLDLARLERLRAGLDRLRVDNARLAIASPAGMPQATLTGLDAVLVNGDQRLRWQLDSDARGALSGLSSAGNLQGALTDIRAGEAHLTIKQVDTLALARGRGLLDENDRALTGGRLDVRLEGRWRAEGRSHIGARMRLAAVRAGDATLLPAIEARLTADRSEPNAPVRLALGRLSSELPGLSATRLGGVWRPDTQRLHVRAHALPAELMRRLASLRFARLSQTRLSGRIASLSFAVGPDTSSELGFDFHDVRIDDPALAAGPMSGRYRLADRVQALHFEAAGGRLSLRRYLRGALAIDNLGGSIRWRRTPAGWRLGFDRLALTSKQAHLQVDGTLVLAAGAAPRVDLSADMSVPDMPRVFAHLPQAENLPNPRLRDWLPKAIKAGALDRAHIEVAGSMDRFPFARPRDGERFHFEAHGQNMDIVYKPGWPVLHDASGTLTLNGDDLRGTLDEGRMLGVAIAPSTGHVADVREPVLNLDAHVKQQPGERMLRFLAESPLRNRFGKLVKAIDIVGPADLDLAMRIPLKPGLGQPEASGTIVARGDTLKHRSLPGPITGIRGRVAFGDGGLRADDLAGHVLGVPLQVKLEPGEKKRQRVIARANVRLPDDRAAVAHYVPDPWLDYAHGETALTVALTMQRSGRLEDIVLDSDLTGLALDLPAPLRKAATTIAPLHVAVGEGAKQAQVAYDNRLRADLRLIDGHPVRIQAILNDPTLTPPEVDGIWIGGRADTVDAPGWFRVIRHVLAASGHRQDERRGLTFTGGDLTIGRLAFDDRYFGNTQIRAQTMHAANGWRIDFDGPDTRGQVTLTRPEGQRPRIAGSLARLALTTESDDFGNDAGPSAPPGAPSPVVWSDVSPDALPRLDIRVADVQVDDTDFGAAQIKASAPAHGWRLDGASLSGGALTGSASGEWIRRAGTTRARGKTRLEGHGLARLLATLGYDSTLRSKKARVHAKLSIDANPNGLDLRYLNGGVDLALDQGTLLSVEPGAGRALGLINLYVLPRRLRLDFRDVVDKGLAFDSVRANFDIRNGNAYANKARIETPSSTILIKGRIGLAARDYDEHVTIRPKLGSGVALASTVLGGPVVGAAVFAVQELLKKPIQKFSSVGYTLKGSWDDPTIAQPSAED